MVGVGAADTKDSSDFSEALGKFRGPFDSVWRSGTRADAHLRRFRLLRYTK